MSWYEGDLYVRHVCDDNFVKYSEYPTYIMYENEGLLHVDKLDKEISAKKLNFSNGFFCMQKLLKLRPSVNWKIVAYEQPVENSNETEKNTM